MRDRSWTNRSKLGSGSLLVTKGIPSENPFGTRTKGHYFPSFCRENNALATHCSLSLGRKAHRSPKVDLILLNSGPFKEME
jgi:hypothetical protein